jgi:hypothetical protein
MNPIEILNKEAVVQILKGSFERNDLTTDQWFELQERIQPEFNEMLFRLIEEIVS